MWSEILRCHFNFRNFENAFQPYLLLMTILIWNMPIYSSIVPQGDASSILHPLFPRENQPFKHQKGRLNRRVWFATCNGPEGFIQGIRKLTRKSNVPQHAHNYNKGEEICVRCVGKSSCFPLCAKNHGKGRNNRFRCQKNTEIFNCEAMIDSDIFRRQTTDGEHLLHSFTRAVAVRYFGACLWPTWLLQWHFTSCKTVRNIAEYFNKTRTHTKLESTQRIFLKPSARTAGFSI